MENVLGLSALNIFLVFMTEFAGAIAASIAVLRHFSPNAAGWILDCGVILWLSLYTGIWS